MKSKNWSHIQKKIFLEKRIIGSIDKPRELWKTLKPLDLPNKTSVCGTNALKVNNAMSFETKWILDAFSNHYSTLFDNFLKKLPTPPNKCTSNFVIQYYGSFIQTDAFRLEYTTEI